MRNATGRRGAFLMQWFWLGIVSVLFAALPLVMTLCNLPLLRGGAARGRGDDDLPASPHGQTVVAVCIPARDEAENLEPCLRSVLGQDLPPGVAVRAFVYDDQSKDATPEILARLAEEDDRVVRVPTSPLPAGWNGKQHACWRMGTAAAERGADWLLFTDADVRFEPGAVRAALEGARRLDAALVSAFPRQITRTLGEALLVPMIFYVLLGYLPLARMRRTNDPAASAGCGQFLFVRTDAYRSIDGHAAFKATMHDGIMMPRALRRAGRRTDLIDGTDLAHVRMYRGFGQTWRGFAKNAYEGLGSVGLLSFITVLHLVGHVLPWVFLAAWAFEPRAGLAPALFASAAAMPVVQRLILARRLRHTPVGALLHPLAILLMTAVQWWSFVLHATGRRSWRGRGLGVDATGA